MNPFSGAKRKEKTQHVTNPKKKGKKFFCFSGSNLLHHHTSLPSLLFQRHNFYHNTPWEAWKIARTKPKRRCAAAQPRLPSLAALPPPPPPMGDVGLSVHTCAELDIQAHKAYLEQAAPTATEEALCSVTTWPPYAWILSSKRDTARTRLHTRPAPPGSAKGSHSPRFAPHHHEPPSDDWINTVLSDWLELLYLEVRAPLEPMLKCVRKAIKTDIARVLEERDDEEIIPGPPSTLPDAKYCSGLRLPKLAEEVLAVMEADLAPEVAGRYRPVVQRMGNYYAQNNPLRRLICDSWLWCWFGRHEAIFPLSLECYVEQGSPCCAAASASGAINIILKRARTAYVEYTPSDEAFLKLDQKPYVSKDALEVMEHHLLEMTLKSADTAGLYLSERQVRVMSDEVAAMLSAGGSLYFAPPTTKQQQKVCLEGIRDYIIGLGLKESYMFANLRWLEDGSRPKVKVATKNLYIFLSNLWGLGKVKTSSPSTARFGSWGVQMAVERISQNEGLGINCATQNACDYTWEEFHQLLHRNMCAVVLHLPNHYAVVFGIKSDQTVVTARKGQPPTDLLTWTELQQIQARSREGSIIVAYHTANPPPLKYSAKASLRYFGGPPPRTKSKEEPKAKADTTKGSNAAKKEKAANPRVAGGAVGAGGASMLPSVRGLGKVKKPVKVETMHF